MSTAFASIMGALVATLATGPAVSPQIHRARLRPLAQDWTTAVVVRPAGGSVDASVGQGVVGIWLTNVAVECYARATSATPPDLVVDALVDSVATRLLANRTLGGLVADLLLTQISWDFDADADNTTCATLVFQIRHATAANSLH